MASTFTLAFYLCTLASGHWEARLDMAENTSSFQTTSANEEAEQEVLGKQIPALALCYVSCSKDSGNAFVGAALVTDHRTRPLEFCYIAPIRPTAMQRLLYGRTLDEHVNVDVIAKRLLEGLSRVSDIIFVDSEVLLEARRLCSVPVASSFYFFRRRFLADSGQESRPRVFL
ncbi:MAG: hypothetical protein V1790_16810 [Planctomycetota bacterium]